MYVLSILVQLTICLNQLILFQFQDDLGSEKYEKLGLASDQYLADGDYESFRNILFEIFQEDRLFTLLKCMPVLSRPEHRSQLVADIENFVTPNQNE